MLASKPKIFLLLATIVLIGAGKAPSAAPGFSGRVLDAVNGTPIAGAIVAVSGGDSTRTADDGSFRIARVAPLQHELQISHDGYPTLQLPELVLPKSGDLKVAAWLRSAKDANDSAGKLVPLIAIHVQPDSEAVGIALTTADLDAFGRGGADSIASIQVWKATAGFRCYGAAGVHGVIVVTLFRGIRASRAC